LLRQYLQELLAEAGGRKSCLSTASGIFRTSGKAGRA
jgi:hypothetical protein